MIRQINFTPSDVMVGAAETVLLARANALALRPIVLGYKREILARHQFTNKAEVELAAASGVGLEPEVITDPGQTYLMSEADFATYLTECKAARAAAGLRVDEDDHCPLLVAEHLVTLAENAFLDIMEPLTGLSRARVMESPDALTNRAELLRLSLDLMARFVSNPLTRA